MTDLEKVRRDIKDCQRLIKQWEKNPKALIIKANAIKALEDAVSKLKRVSL